MSPDRACPRGDLRGGYMVELRVSKQYTLACQKPQPAASRWLVDCLRLASFPRLVFDPLCSPCALAVVYLTRREDLIVTEETNDIGVDLWVTLNLEEEGGP